MQEQRGFAPIIVLIVLALLIAGGAFYLKQSKKPTVIQTQEEESTGAQSMEEARPRGEMLNPQVTPPEKFGFTKQSFLVGIGVKALFPKDTKISYTDPSVNYSAFYPNNHPEFAFPFNQLSFTLYDYQGGGRRAWFRANIGFPDYVFEEFGANNHKGYMAYRKGDDGKPNFYFTVTSPTKMLVVGDYGTASGQDLEKFKSFVSTIQMTSPDLQAVGEQGHEKVEYLRWSDTRKTLWESQELGLRITAPEWIETKPPGQESWTRIYTEAKATTERVSVSGNFFGGSYLTFLDSKYTGKTLNEVVNELLPGAGFCAEEWAESKSQCANPDYCYTKEEVLQNLLLKETVKLGPYTSQRRTLNAAFSQKNDCRADNENVWLIQVKGGRFVLTTISPDSDTIKIEAI